MKWKNFSLLFVLAAMWGPSYLFIKMVIEDVTPYTLAAGRTLVGAVFLLMIAKISGIKLPKFGKVWWHIFVNGLFASSIPFLLFGYGEHHCSSAMAGIINGTTPISAALLAHIFISSERLNLSRALGVLAGLMGFLVLALPHFLSESHSATLWGIGAIGIASTCYAIAMVYSKKYLMHLSPIACTASQLLAGCLYLIPLALITEPGGVATLTYKSFGALLGLGLLGTGGAYLLYYYLMQRTSVTLLALSNYLLPLFSTVLGALFLREHLTWPAYFAGGLIILGMMMVNGTIKLRTRASQEEIE